MKSIIILVYCSCKLKFMINNLKTCRAFCFLQVSPVNRSLTLLLASTCSRVSLWSCFLSEYWTHSHQLGHSHSASSLLQVVLKRKDPFLFVMFTLQHSETLFFAYLSLLGAERVKGHAQGPNSGSLDLWSVTQCPNHWAITVLYSAGFKSESIIVRVCAHAYLIEFVCVLQLKAISLHDVRWLV